MPRRTPEQMIGQAIALLAEAGALDPLLTVVEAASLACVTPAAVRVGVERSRTLWINQSPAVGEGRNRLIQSQNKLSALPSQ